MKVHSALALLCISILSFSTHTLACTCSREPDLESALNSNTGAVFRGKVIQQLISDGAHEYSPKKYLVRVVIPYKGCSFERNDHVVVATGSDSGVCGVYIEESDEFLFSGDSEPADKDTVRLAKSHDSNSKVSTSVWVHICTLNVPWSSVSNSERIELWRFPSTAQEQLYNARSKWLNFQNYNYLYDAIGFFPDDVLATKFVRVRGGEVKSVTFDETGDNYDEHPAFPIKTIEEIFDIIQRAVEDDVYDIRVNYDTTYGYPTRVYIDYGEQTLHDEFIVEISELVVLSD